MCLVEWLILYTIDTHTNTCHVLESTDESPDSFGLTSVSTQVVQDARVVNMDLSEVDKKSKCFKKFRSFDTFFVWLLLLVGSADYKSVIGENKRTPGQKG